MLVRILDIKSFINFVLINIDFSVVEFYSIAILYLFLYNRLQSRF